MVKKKVSSYLIASRARSLPPKKDCSIEKVRSLHSRSDFAPYRKLLKFMLTDLLDVVQLYKLICQFSCANDCKDPPFLIVVGLSKSSV